jgi:hypothetical protein
MSVISVLPDDAFGGWSVWINLDDGTEAPEGLSFIIGAGTTRDEAVAEAVADLEARIAELQQPPPAGGR